jgi:hypothetical protein
MQPRHRRQAAGAADLDVDALEHRRRLLGGELVGDGPARRAGDKAKPLLPVQPVDLVDDAVDVIGQRRPGRADIAIDAQQPLRVLHPARAVVGGEAPGRQHRQRLALGRGEWAADFAPGVGEEPQRPFGRDGRIDLAQGAGGKVARVGVGALAGGLGDGVERLELRQRRIDLASDLDHVRNLARQPGRDVLQGAQVGGDVLAGAAVAPGRAADQDALLVADRGGQTVNLGLGREGHRLVRRQIQETAHPGDEGLDLLVREGVVQAEHRHAMLDRRELLRPRGADLQGRAVLSHQMRKVRLDLFVTTLERVVLGVADRRGVMLVIAQVMPGQFVGEPLKLDGGFGFGEVGDGDHGHEACVARFVAWFETLA